MSMPEFVNKRKTSALRINEHTIYGHFYENLLLTTALKCIIL